jgi:hypothetical protein
MDFRTLLNKIDNVHSESAEEVSTVEAKKEQTQKQYTSVNDVISDLNKAVFAEPSKSQIKYSSANIQKWTDPRAEVSFKMDELALRIKNNDDLSLFLNKVATLVGDNSKQLSPALQQVVKAVMDKHKDLPMEKDPESEIPYKDPGQDEFEDIQKEDEKDSDPNQSANPADANDNIDDNPSGDTTIKSTSDQDADTRLDSKALSALRLVMDDPQRAVLAKRAIEMIMQGKPLQRLQINAFADAMQKMMAPFLSPAGVTKLKALSKTMPEDVQESGIKRALENDAESMSREEFIEKHGDAEFFDEYNGVEESESHYPHKDNFQELYGIDDIALYKEMADDAQDMEMHEFHDTYSSVIDMADEFWEDHQDEETVEDWFQGQHDVTLNGDEFYETFGWIEENDEHVEEAEYQGRKVKLSKPMRGDVKKFKVYVKNPKGNVVKVNFGDPDMRIKKSNPARRKSFRARHNCDSPGPKHKARYWSCKKW